RLNASLVVHHVRPENCAQVLDTRYQPPAMRSGLLSGVVLIFRWPLQVVRELSRMMPTVSIAHRYPGVDIDCVSIDNQAGIELLVRHLEKLGHRKIGFFGRCRDVHWATVRFGAYVAALTNIGAEYRP